MNTTLDLGNNSPVPSSLPFAQEKEQKKKANKASVSTSTRSLRAYSTLQYAVQATIEFSSTRQEEREIIYSQRRRRWEGLASWIISSLRYGLTIAYFSHSPTHWLHSGKTLESSQCQWHLHSSLSLSLYIYTRQEATRETTTKKIPPIKLVTFSHQLFLFLKKELKLLLFQKYKVNSNEEERRKKRGFKAQVIMIIFSDKQTIFLS